MDRRVCKIVRTGLLGSQALYATLCVKRFEAKETIVQEGVVEKRKPAVVPMSA